MIEAYIAKYGKEPNATQLTQFSKSDSRDKAISFKEAKKLLINKQSPSKRKNAIKPPTPSATNKIDKDEDKNKNKPASIWDINKNDGDDPMGATYRKKAILNDYNMNKSAINDISAESMAKQKAGIVSPETIRMKSVFDESSSDEDDDNNKKMMM